MTVSIMWSSNKVNDQNQLSELQIKQFFNVLKANIVRSRVTMTAVFLTGQNIETFSKEAMGQADFDLFLKDFLKSC